MSIVDFLTDRIIEDESWAYHCGVVFTAPWDVSDRGWMAKVTADGPHFHQVAEINQDQDPDRDSNTWLGDRLQHIANWQPARVLAECKAKRAIIAAARAADDQWDPFILALVQPYAGHPDFDPKWGEA